MRKNYGGSKSKKTLRRSMTIRKVTIKNLTTFQVVDAY